jgi:hypothetical protein
MTKQPESRSAPVENAVGDIKEGQIEVLTKKRSYFDRFRNKGKTTHFQ